MKQLLPYIFGFVFLAIVAGAVIYLSKRFSFYFSLSNLKLIYLAFAALVVFMIVGLAAFTNSTTQIGSFMYKLGATLLGFTLYLLISVLLIDLTSLILSRIAQTSESLLKVNPAIYGITALALAFFITLYGIVNAFNIRSKELAVELEGIKNEVSIIHWSDVHLGHFRGERFLQKIVKQSNEAKPDMLVITGDLFDGKIQLSADVLEPLRDLNAPVYFVEGNHDKYTGVEKVKALLREKGVTVLENEVIETHGIQLVGLNHMIADSSSVDMHASGDVDNMKDVLQKLPINGLPSVLLHHSPDGIEYANKAGIDLYLSGHTHGGQEFPVNILNNYLFKYNKGLHTYKNTQIFVSMGVGTFGPPVRIGTHGELVKVRLVVEE